MNNWCICWLTARHLYKSFGVKGLIRNAKGKSTMPLLTLKLFIPHILNHYIVLMYQLNVFTLHYITVTSFRHVSALQCHLQLVHTKSEPFTVTYVTSRNIITLSTFCS
jgi:hypothetical protein